VLNVIRKLQPISRAEISRHTRMQRSTVSAITEQLIAEQGVTVGPLGDLPRGRKPTFLKFNAHRAGVVGVDVRPIETTIALADLEMRFLAQETFQTGSDPARFIQQLCERVPRMIESYRHISCEGIGVALPGRIDLVSNRLVFAPNLGWDAVDLKKPLQAATGLTVELENAANACALAEMWGEAHSAQVRNLLAVTVSEGIGVGMIFNGQLVRGTTGLAGEFGHIILEEGGPACKCGKRGCFEACASNTAAIRYFTEIVSKRNGQPKAVQPTFDFIIKMAEKGDRNAAESLNRVARWLGAGLALMATALAPDVIVLIGEVTRAWKQIGPIILDAVERDSRTGVRPRIVPADPSTQPRLRGTIALVLQKHFGAMRAT
jgi:predicted NBD/HSP70 family sugar kinase